MYMVTDWRKKLVILSGLIPLGEPSVNKQNLHIPKHLTLHKNILGGE
jgi:hypothetical protein